MVEQSEAFAFEVIRRVTGFEVEPTDDGAQDRMVDGAWDDDQGRHHRVEVTRLIGTAMGELMSLLRKTDYRIAASLVTKKWSASVEPTVRVGRLERGLDPLLARCEQFGVGHLAEAPWSWLRQVPLGEHVVAGDLDAWCRGGDSDGFIEVLPPGRSGAATDMKAVPPWLSHVLTTDSLLVSKVAKLRTAHGDVRHLFIGFHSYGVPFDVGYAFWDPDDTPTAPPTLPSGLDGVWLAPSLSQPPLTWLPDGGWERHDVLDRA